MTFVGGINTPRPSARRSFIPIYLVDEWNLEKHVNSNFFNFSS